MEKNDLCQRCREIVLNAAEYDPHLSHTFADLYKQFREVESRIKALSHIVEREATKELI